MLLSPIGYQNTEIKEGFTDEELEEKFRGMKDHPRWFIELARYVWKNQLSPFGVGRLLGQR